MLVNNAGVMLLGPIENAPTDEWRQMIHANVFADVDPLQSEDIAAAILYAIGQPPNVAVNEVLVRPSRQVR